MAFSVGQHKIASAGQCYMAKAQSLIKKKQYMIIF
jgi:hypothetical protein